MNRCEQTYWFFLFSFLYQIGGAILVASFFQHTSISILWQLAIQSFVSFFPPILLWVKMEQGSLKEVLRLQPLSASNCIMVALLTLLCIPIVAVLSSIAALFYPNTVSILFAQLSTQPLWFSLIVLAVLPAFWEELLFRGFILTGLQSLSLKKRILLTGLLFALIHASPQQFLYALVMGAFFCFLVEVTQSIYASMLSHFLINGIQTIGSVLAFRYPQSIFRKLNMPTPVEYPQMLKIIAIAFVFSCIFFVLCIYVLLKQNPKLKAVHPAQAQWFYWPLFYSLLLYIVFRLS